METVIENMPDAASDRHSHLVRPQDMEWQKTRVPGCEAKTLLFDRSSGLMTALMRFAPGSVLPDHEHVGVEQSYVIEGALVDNEGPAKGITCKAGEFIWREAGSRHAACCPEGALILAIFQVPNKFFEADGRGDRRLLAAQVLSSMLLASMVT